MDEIVNRDKMQSVRITVTGNVCHTGYRYFIRQMAAQCRISGYVCYGPGESVEIEATGEEDNLEEFLQFCKVGNKGSLVKTFNAVRGTGTFSSSSFEVADTW